jgi:hypothetical protein
MARDLEKLHAEGAAKWGGDWMEANVRACNVLMTCGLRPEQYKELGALIALKLCLLR